MSTALIVFLKPFMLLCLMVVFVLPIEMVLRRVWPAGSLKSVLFDRTFRDRHPYIFDGVVLGLWVFMLGGVALLYRYT